MNKKFDSPALRLAIAGVLVGLIFTSFSLRLMSYQVVHGEEYKTRVQQGITSRQRVQPVRGEILDRYGRPFAVNQVGYDVIINVAYLPMEDRNAVIQKMITMMESAGQQWIDNMPVSWESPFTFLEGPEYENRIKQLKKSAGNLTADTTAQVTMENILEKYGLEKTMDLALARKIAGVRYEMERTGANSQNPYTFAVDIPIELVMKIKEYSFALPGIEIAQSTTRHYVDGDLASHVVGITGLINEEEYQQLDKSKYQYNDKIGKSGLEKAMEPYLKGSRGVREITTDAKGNVISSVEAEPAIPGNTVITTLDKDLQRVALLALEDQIKLMQQTLPEDEGGKANSGSAVVIKVKTGEVLAMANYPTYNLENYYSDYSTLVNDPLKPLYNRAALGTYVPGSIFKPVVGLAGLSTGEITAEDTVNCTHIYTRFTGYQPQCMGYHGEYNVMQALMVSCNIFFYDVGYRIGIDTFTEYARQLGLGVETGIEIEESTGRVSTPEVFEELRKNNSNPEKWQEGNVLQAAIGQLDNKFTPLQLAVYAATLGNNGVRMKPHLVKSIESYNMDETIEEIEPEVAYIMDVDKEHFETIREGMVLSSHDPVRGSSRYYLGSYPIQVASKTGTPEASAEKLNATFIAYAPAQDPEIALAVVIEDGYSGQKCAPVAKAILDEYFGFTAKAPETSPAQGQLLP